MSEVFGYLGACTRCNLERYMCRGVPRVAWARKRHSAPTLQLPALTLPLPATVCAHPRPQLPDLLAPGGHFFMVTVLENEPEGESIEKSARDTSYWTPEPDPNDRVCRMQERCLRPIRHGRLHGFPFARTCGPRNLIVPQRSSRRCRAKD